MLVSSSRLAILSSGVGFSGPYPGGVAFAPDAVPVKVRWLTAVPVPVLCGGLPWMPVGPRGGRTNLPVPVGKWKERVAFLRGPGWELGNGRGVPVAELAGWYSPGGGAWYWPGIEIEVEVAAPRALVIISVGRVTETPSRGGT
jgi:hypothetical protein